MSEEELPGTTIHRTTIICSVVLVLKKKYMYFQHTYTSLLVLCAIQCTCSKDIMHVSYRYRH